MTKGYLDNAATTELIPCVKDAIATSLDMFGNPSSLHSIGYSSEKLISSAKVEIAKSLKCREDELIFTSGGSEADNLAVLGAAEAMHRRGNRVVTTAVEHSAILGAMKELEKRGFEVVYINPGSDGSITLSDIEAAIDEKTVLVSVMYCNNETGAIFPVDKLKAVIRKKGSPALLHCDFVQGYGKYTLIPEKAGIDLVSISSHKIHGPKGVGALYIKKGVRILPQIHGGEQQGGIRPGTEPLNLIAGFGAAVREINNRSLVTDEQAVLRIKQYITDKLCDCEDIAINSPKNGSAYVLNLSVLGIRSETMLHFLEERGVYISSGSACAKGAPSHVLKAMGLNARRADSAIRISFSRYSTYEDVDMLIDGINEARKSLIRAK